MVTQTHEGHTLVEVCLEIRCATCYEAELATMRLPVRGVRTARELKVDPHMTTVQPIPFTPEERKALLGW